MRAPSRSIAPSHARWWLGIVLVATTAAALLVPASALAIGQIVPAHEGLKDIDTRTGQIQPTAEQRQIAQSLGTTVRWNRFGTPQSMIKYGGYLATGLSGDPVAAARAWITSNRALFRLSAAGVSTERLELLNDQVLTGTDAHAVLFRQRFGDLPAAQDGMITVGIKNGSIAYVSSSAVGSDDVPGAATVSPAAAWVAAAANVGRSATVAGLLNSRTDRGWTLFDVSGISDPARARLVAFPTTTGVVPAYETIVLDVQAGDAHAYTHFVHAQTGAILFRQNRVQQLAAAAPPTTGTFTGTTAGNCGPDHAIPVPAGTRAIDVVASADIPANDIVLNLLRPNPDRSVAATSDTATSPEGVHYPLTPADPGYTTAATWIAQVCKYVPADPNFSYSGFYATNDVAGGGERIFPYPPKWKFFPANPRLDQDPTPLYTAPPLDMHDQDTRLVGCWETSVNNAPPNTPTPVPGCTWYQALQNTASRAPWDYNVRTNQPTYTTLGNNSTSSEAWASPLTPAENYRPISAQRNYDFPWTDQWNNSKCNPTSLTSPQRNDIDAAVVNLFVAHNRMHDWAYYLGFTERHYNMQDEDFGNNDVGRELDPEIGNAQAGASAVGGPPTYLGRDNANQITLNDGIPGITNMYLWQPIAAGFYPPCADGDYDMSVIGHEYTHATSNRMVGGPDANLTGLQAGAMGESWSDLNGVEIQLEFGYPMGSANEFAVGPYVTGNQQRGIRNYGMNQSQLNFSDIGYDSSGPQVHADGEIWSATNYDIRQALVSKYNASFPASDVDLQRRCAMQYFAPNGSPEGPLPAYQCPGNRRWMQILYDAWLLMQPNVSMLDARDAYLAADCMRFGNGTTSCDAGANQVELWRAFAQRGMGVNAANRPALGNKETDPKPNFESAVEENEATVTFRVQDEGGTPILNADVFVGRFEARVTPIADTYPAPAVNPEQGVQIPDTARFVPGTYTFVVQAAGFGHFRFGRTFAAGETINMIVTMPTNFASSSQGAVASGDGINHNKLIDDTEATNWTALNRVPDVTGTQVTVLLGAGAATPGVVPRRVSTLRASAMLHPPDPNNTGDTGGQNRFTALRSFEVYGCNGTVTNCLLPTNFTKIYTSSASFFPGRPPRPTAQDWLLGVVTPQVIGDWTHLRLRVLTNQCTGNPAFQGDQDNDPTSNSDCRSGTIIPGVNENPAENQVRAAELQAIGPSSGGTGGGGVVGGTAADPVVVLTKAGPTTAARGSHYEYTLSYRNLGPFASQNAKIVDRLPAGLRFVSSTGGGVYNHAARTVTWNLGSVAKDATGSLKLNVQLSPTASVGSVLVNQAEFTGDLTVSPPVAAATAVTP